MKKVTTPQVQVKFPGSYNVLFSFFSISIKTIGLRNICYAVAAVVFKNREYLRGWSHVHFHPGVKLKDNM